jgi:hypothetical protein
LHLRNWDAAAEGEGVRLVAQGVYVGTGMLAADKDARCPRARSRSFGTKLVLVVAVQEVRITGQFVGRVDRHTVGTWLLEVEYALRCVPHALSSPVAYALRISVAGLGAGVNVFRGLFPPPYAAKVTHMGKPHGRTERWASIHPVSFGPSA